MQKIEDKRTEVEKPAAKEKKARSAKSSKAVGVASTFDGQELKNFFVNYLTTMLVIEGLIFFFCFVNHLSTDSANFPWKPYLFATFITPIAITFVFGLIILTFNKFFFRGAVEEPPDDESPYAGVSFNKGDRLGSFFQVVHRMPFLLSMLLLIVGTAVAYNLDSVVLYAAQAGATTAQYLFFTTIGLLAVAVLGIATWMLLSYRLRQTRMTSSHQYKMQLMDQFGMVLMDDGTMLDKDGNVVYQQNTHSQLDYDSPEEAVQLIEEVKTDD